MAMELLQAGGAVSGAPSSFMDRIHRLDAERTDARSVFESAGSRMDLNNDDPRWLMKIAETQRFINDLRSGRRDKRDLREAMTSSDFPLLLGNTLGRQMIGYYLSYPTTYRNYCRISSVKDFRLQSRNYLDGARGLLTRRAERVPGNDRSYAEGAYTFRVNAYEDFIDLTWEMLVNDDLGGFENVPRDLGFAAARTEEYLAASLFVGTTGPDSTFFTNAHLNIVNTACGASSNNPPLSIAAIKQAMGVMYRQRDADGLPILIQGMHLVVGASLSTTAKDIQAGLQVWTKNEATGGSAVTGQNLVSTNWVADALQVHVNPFIEYIASSSNGDTSWFLFADPNMSQRPALEMASLQGFEQPGIFRKKSDMEQVYGGSNGPVMASDFETGGIRHKVVLVKGGVQLDPKMACASNGSGS